MVKRTFLGLLVGLIAITMLAGQAAAQPAPYRFYFDVVDEAGISVTSGVVAQFYTAGTTTASTIYSDANATALTNPITCTSTGRCSVFMATSAAVDVYVRHADGLIRFVSLGTGGPHRLVLHRRNLSRPSTRVVPIRNESGGALAAGDLVYLSSWSETNTRFLVSKADADVAGARAAFIVPYALANNTNGFGFVTLRLTGQNVGGSVGDPVYLSTTAGGWTLTAPTAAGLRQIVGRVAVVSATVGEIEFDLASHNAPTGATGFIDIPLASLREIFTNDIGNAATAAATGSGGILAKDTTPILERINGATDKALRVKWAAGNVDAVTFQFSYPPDLDDAQPVVVNILAKSGGATDTPTITVAYFEGVGDTNAGSATAALSATLAKVTASITAANVGPYPTAATVELVPGTHGTDTVEITGIWIEYVRK